jgi:hypothetical protein
VIALGRVIRLCLLSVLLSESVPGMTNVDNDGHGHGYDLGTQQKRGKQDWLGLVWKKDDGRTGYLVVYPSSRVGIIPSASFELVLARGADVRHSFSLLLLLLLLLLRGRRGCLCNLSFSIM